MITQIKFILISIILICSSTALALSYTSPNYSLKNARIVISGGKACSSNYSLTEVQIGKVTSGKAESLNYTLEASTLEKRTPPHPPTVNPVTTPTNITAQTLSGSKDPNTSIYINGYLCVPLDDKTSWSYQQALNQGANHFLITARNRAGLESQPVYVQLTLNAHPPVINLIIPPEGSAFYPAELLTIQAQALDPDGDMLQYQFSVDSQIRQAWSASSSYNWIILSADVGLRTIKVEVTDNLGGLASMTAEVYIFLAPIGLPTR